MFCSAAGVNAPHFGLIRSNLKKMLISMRKPSQPYFRLLYNYLSSEIVTRVKIDTLRLRVWAKGQMVHMNSGRSQRWRSAA